MWSVFGDFIVKENASLEIINTFMIYILKELIKILY